MNIPDETLPEIAKRTGDDGRQLPGMAGPRTDELHQYGQGVRAAIVAKLIKPEGALRLAENNDLTVARRSRRLLDDLESLEKHRNSPVCVLAEYLSSLM